jgi:hypothetical protein
MSDELFPLEEAIIEEEPAPPKPKRKPRKKTVKRVVKAATAIPKKVVKEVISVPKKVIETVEEVIEKVKPKYVTEAQLSGDEPIIEDEEAESDYGYYPDGTCWLCRRTDVTGADIDLISGNGVFSLFMCGDCQLRFRKG